MPLRGSSTIAGVARSLAGLMFVSLLLLVAPAASQAAPLAWSAPAHVDASYGLVAVSCPTTTFCAAGDTAGNLLTSDPAAATWPVTGTDSSGVSSLSCGTPTFCAAGDGGGRAVSFDGTTWGPRTAPPGQAFGFNSVSCTSATFCFAGTGVTTTPRTLDAGATWVSGNTQGVNYPGSINAVSCVPGSDATTGFCVVVDNQGSAFPSSDGGVNFSPPNRNDGVISGASGLNSVSCASATACVTVDSGGKAFYYRGGTAGGADWTAVSADPGHALTSVSCVPGSPSSQTFCVAVDDRGSAIETADGGATWSTPASITSTAGTPRLNAVSCPTATFCVAVDTGGHAYLGAPQAAPANIGTAPVIAAQPAQVGQSPALSCNDAGVVWTGPAPTVGYRWQSSVPSSGTWTDVALAGTAQSYAPVAGDVGNLLRCVVTATNTGGSADAASAATAAVLAAPVPSVPAEPVAPAPTPTITVAVVPPAATPAPTTTPALTTRPSNRVASSALSPGGSSRLTAQYDLPGAGKLDVTARHYSDDSPTVVLAKVTRVAGAPGRVTLKVTLSVAGRRMLKRNGELHVVLTTRFTPTGGTTRQSSRTALIRLNARGTWVVTDVTGAA